MTSVSLLFGIPPEGVTPWSCFFERHGFLSSLHLACTKEEQELITVPHPSLRIMSSEDKCYVDEYDDGGKRTPEEDQKAAWGWFVS